MQLCNLRASGFYVLLIYFEGEELCVGYKFVLARSNEQFYNWNLIKYPLPKCYCVCTHHAQVSSLSSAVHSILAILSQSIPNGINFY